MTGIQQATSTGARTLTDRIKVALEGTWLLIQEAYTSRAWSALGYATWDAYCTAEFGDAQLRPPKERRREVVTSMRQAGLSLRAIESVTSVSRKTIIRDCAEAVEVESVYFIEAANGLIKIGRSTDPLRRLRGLQTGSPVQLRMVLVLTGLGVADEMALHDRFAEYRSHGEWFHPGPDLIEFVRGSRD